MQASNCVPPIGPATGPAEPPPAAAGAHGSCHAAHLGLPFPVVALRARRSVVGVYPQVGSPANGRPGQEQPSITDRFWTPLRLGLVIWSNVKIVIRTFAPEKFGDV